ncbi:MAG: serine/threonine protein kinase, partial [Phycisphaerae bacterium]|nr:serine/threonine protein kinase [Phycisphaerae bacterium]
MCPNCGQPLPNAETPEPDELDAGMDQLTADLREAFGSGAYEALCITGDTGTGVSGRVAKPSVAQAPSMEIGSCLDDFELLGELGRGGMGIVYRARQVSLNREVALKVLPSVARRNRSAVARFRRESQAAARLHHTNIVPVYAQGEEHGKFYYAMELIEGESLDSAIRCDSSVANLTPRKVTPPTGLGLRSGDITSHAHDDDTPRLDVTTVHRTRYDYRHLARLMAEVADGLEHAHHNGVIHRDIKPQNLLLGQDNHLHITDFGLAHLVGEPHMTLSGEVMGTPAYMSPEQVEAGYARIDHRTDIYSLGVSLYELLTLRRPFEGETREQIIHCICSADPPALRRIDLRIPVDLETICLRAMEKEPTRRYPTAAALAEDLLRFAQDRPIRTRRISRIERLLKWSRRHKAATTAIIAASVAVVMTVALATSVIGGRRREAARLIQNAYDHLVYHDYQEPQVVSDDIDQADRLGADARLVHLARALASMRADTPAALEHLQAVLEDDAGDLETVYLLSWAQHINNNLEDSRRTFNRAETLGEPRMAAEWFFRGLAVHFDDPTEAISCYEQARRLRAADNDFFPQATLHLARARNQLMYRTRRIETFAEVDRSLRELMGYDIYGVYPYYLASITHRLVAEVYTGSEGTRGENALLHFQQALELAVDAQELYPDEAERALTAEAECHESMGNFAAAVKARSAAIRLAHESGSFFHEWEGYHYRWRLHYWRGEFREALEDLGKLSGEFDSNSFFYANVYPALAHAESGGMARALELARAIAVSPDGTPDNRARRVLWSATCLRLLGRPQEAEDLLHQRVGDLDFSAELLEPQSESWMRKLYEFSVGELGLDELLAETADVHEAYKLEGEAYFHAAVLKLVSGDRTGAGHDFEEAYRSFDNQRRYTFHAQVIRMKMRQDQDWPPWIARVPHPVSPVRRTGETGWG